MSGFNFVLTGSAAQRVHDSLICLSKFSEYVCLEARRNRLVLSALNSTKSSYGAVALSSTRFFEEYQFTEDYGADADAEGPRFTCRLYAKALLAAFRQRYSDSKDKAAAVQKCEVSLQDDPSRPECRLLIKLICKHGVLKTYKLTYEEVDVMAPVFDRASAHNRWIISSKLMMEYMAHFAPRAEYFDVSSDNGRASFTSFTEGLTDGKEILKMAMHTNIALDTSDFEFWNAEDRIHIAVSLKDMRAIVTHAASINSPLSMFYSDPGAPLQAAYEDNGMKCEFTMMTMADVRAAENFPVIARVQSRPTANPTSRANSAFLVSQRRAPSWTQNQSQQLPPNDELLFRAPTSSFQASPSASAQRTQMRPPATPALPQSSQPRPPTTPAPPQSSQPQPSLSQIPPSRPMTQGLFLPFDSDEDSSSDDDLGRRLDDWDEPMVRWDSGGNDAMPSISVVRDQIAPHMRRDERGDETESEAGRESDTTMVGPTPEVSQARGLFD